MYNKKNNVNGCCRRLHLLMIVVRKMYFVVAIFTINIVQSRANHSIG